MDKECNSDKDWVRDEYFKFKKGVKEECERYRQDRGTDTPEVPKSKESTTANATHKDEGKPRMDLVPPEAINGLAEVLGIACSPKVNPDTGVLEPPKYEERNWEKGMDWGKAYGSLQRHLNSWWGGEDLDPETGKSHLKHALANLSFLITYEERGIGADTRKPE